MDEMYVPIIAEGVKWVKENLGPSKKTLKIKIADLEEQVKILSYGNQALIESIGQIVPLILEHLKAEGHYTVNANTIIQINENQGQVTVAQAIQTNQLSAQSAATFNPSTIFDGVDEEILHARLKRPSEME